MTSRQRLQTAWSYQEPDRVPIEIHLYAPAKGVPGSEIIEKFIAEEADNFTGVAGFNWGFFGIDAEYREEVVEDVPDKYRRIRRVYSTAVGEFDAITIQDYDELDPNDYHWEKRFIATLDDFKRLANARRDELRPFVVEAYNSGCREVGERGLPMTGIHHPLGMLMRRSNMEEAYMWLLAEPELTERFLRSTNEQIAASIRALKGVELVEPPIFVTYALEMLIPPWLGKEQFMKFIFPYDKMMNEAIHDIGGRHRAHAHGNTGEFLELFVEMGIDSVEPLEPPPNGDNCLADAKRRVGNSMLLSGNVASPEFYSCSRADVREMVRRSIDAGAPGGGFSLRTTGGAVGNGKTMEQVKNSVARSIDYIEAALEFGKY